MQFFQFPILATIKPALWRTETMKKKLIYRLASLGLAISCAFVSIPVEGLSGVLTVYAGENTEETETTESTEVTEITEVIESTEEVDSTEVTETTEETESTEVSESTETVDTTEVVEDSTDDIMPLNDSTEAVQEIDSVYLDAANNVSYYYYGYSDGTAKIYNVTFPSGGVLEFPSTINSYTVTEVTLTDIGSSDNRPSVSVLTLPESVTYFGGASFRYFDIGTLNYNTNATNYGTVSGFMFDYATISNLVIGENVNYIDTWTFEGATFLFSELTLSVKTIGAHAFRGVWNESNPATLTLTENVESIDSNAFALNYYNTVNVNCSAASGAWTASNSVFLDSSINNLNIGENVTKIGSYMFYQTHVPFTELTLNVPSIETGAFGKIWTGDQKCILTLTEKVTYIEDLAFSYNNFTTVNYGCSASTLVEYGSSGIFYHSYIDSLIIDPSVTKIAAYAFNESYLNFNELIVDVEEIGTSAFGHLWAEQNAGTITLTERVNFIHPTAFGYGNYAMVTYNANADGESRYDYETIFYKANIADLSIGENVTKLPGWLFYKAVFGIKEVTVNVETIGEYAFGHMWEGAEAGTLNLGERVSYIYPSAFAYGNFAVLNFSANASGESTYDTQGLFYKATIEDININECVTKLPAFTFYNSYFGEDEITVNVESIGKHAFSYLWNGATAGTLTIGERVNYIYPSAFSRGNFAKVNYKANADGESDINTEAIFYYATIADLTIDENVSKLPAFLFYYSTFSFQELTVNVETIGEYAFGYVWKSANQGKLTLGEKVTSVGERSFCNLVLEKLYYNADAKLVTASSYLINGSFEDSIIYELDFGEDAELIGYAMFKDTDIRDSDVVINVKKIESYAFNNAWSSAYPVNLTIGEDVEIINTKVFGNIYIDHLQYNAKNMLLTTITSTSNSPFNGATLSSLSFGDRVEKINDFTFYNIKLTQEDLIIPDSVTHIGANVFNNGTASNLVFTNLYIGSGLQNVKSNSFGKERTFANIYVDAVTADSTYKSTSLTGTSTKANLPVAETVHIHMNSDFYYYFAGKAENVDVYCEEHYERTTGEEYLDTSTAQYVTPTYDTCDVCSYVKTMNTYVDAFTVNFYVNGELYHTDYTKAGGSIEAPENPTLDAYNFKGWDKEFTNVSENTDVNAILELKTYTVTFKDHDGTVLETQTVEHGSSATGPTDPSRDGHTFTGWNKDYSNITEDTEITATYNINFYTVTFLDYDGTELSTIEVQYQSVAITPIPTEREGYTFKEWDKDVSCITEDMTVTAVYEKNKYLVNFLDYDGSIINTQHVSYQEDAVLPENPTREGYTFVEWSGIWKNITSTSIVTAVYEINTYTVEFFDYDGTLLSRQTITHGNFAQALENPEREGYEFTGWDKDFSCIREDTTITAKYRIKVFEVIFKVLGEIFSTQEVEYGNSATDPGTPTMEEEDWGRWIFIGWDNAWDYITGNLTINAVLEEDYNTYTVTFVDYDGTVLKEQTVVHGNGATPPENPYREGYHFLNWDREYGGVTEDITVTAVYEIDTHLVYFLDYDGTLLDYQFVNSFEDATPPEVPTREGYTFTGWDTDWHNITIGCNITATYAINVYEVVFQDYDGTPILVQTVEHGSEAVVPETPEREGYTFIGWDKAYDSITENTIISAMYEINEYTVTFKDHDGSVIDTQTVTHGSNATLPEEPVREGYTFKEWSGAWENITADTTITAVYAINSYTVIFKDHDGNIIDTQSVSYGSSATAPENPIRVGYDFVSWDKDFTNIQSDLEITATYTIKMLTVTFKDGENIISTQQIAYGNDAVEPETPCREQEEWGIWIFKNWDNSWTNITENIEINAVFEKQLNQYRVTFVDFDGTVLDTQMILHGKSATAPVEPMREGHTFKKWDKDYSNITEDMTITAVYEIHTFTVTFVDYEGSIIDTQSVKYKESAILPEIPTRAGYTFKEWQGTWENITEDSTVTAVYDINIYKVDFVDYDGTVIDSQSVEYGKSATAPTEPARKGYTFKSWDKDYNNVTENMTVTAVYNINSYTVTFVDYDGIVIDTQSVNYMKSAILPETPTRAGYTFKEWQGTWENITEDSTVTAVYGINIYKVDFVDYDGTVIGSQSVEHGKSATAPTEPIREGYTFKKWDKDYSIITENLIVTAVYEKNHVHEYAEEIERKDATCIEKGYVISKCSCGDSETKELDINPNNHSGETEVKNKKAASCTEKGYTGDTYCKSCTTKIKDGKETDLEEHTPGETKVENRVEPTTEEKGSYDEVIYCEICNTELSRTNVEIPMIEPDEPDDSEEDDPEEDDTEEDDPEEDDSEEDDSEEDDSEDDDSDEENSEEPEAETEQEPELEPESELESEDDDKTPQIEDIVVPIVVAAGVSGGTGSVYFIYWRRRRKIFGTVLDEQGNPIENAKIYLEGSVVKETITDENGYFEFKNLKVGMYKFMLCNDLDVLLMEAEIFTEEQDIDKMLTIMEAKCEVEFEKEHKNISFIITI